MLDLELLKFFLNRENFTRYKKYVKPHTILRETDQILTDIEEYFKTHPVDEINVEHLALWFRVVRHPMFDSARAEAFQVLFDKLAKITTVDATIINRFVHLDYTAQVRDLCNRVIDGAPGSSLTEAAPLIEGYANAIGAVTSKDDDLFVAPDLKSILEDVYRTHGLEWRLEDLNVCVGPVRSGDFVIVGARPETGKTSFIASELTHLTTQLELQRHAIVFNNEEDGKKIFARLVQACANMSMTDMIADEQKAIDTYVKNLGALDRIKVVHKEGISVREIERILSKGDYGVIAFNILDKIAGFEKEDNDVSRMRKLAQWARGIAQRHKAVVLGLMQADASGEGKAWLDQSQLYGSKTGVQGEADVILMIGNTYEIDTRYISVCKNKLPGGPRTKPSERHGKFETWFDMERSRYASKRY